MATEACPVKLQINFPGGDKGCLTDLPVSKMLSKQWKISIGDVVKNAANYVVVAGPSCDVAEVFTSNYYHPAQLASLNSRAEAYVRSCSEKCNCSRVINDGTVMLRKDLMLGMSISNNPSTELSDLSDNKSSFATSQIRESEKPSQNTTSRIANSDSLITQTVQPEALKSRPLETDLLAQISAELSRLRAENEAVKEERKALSQSLANLTNQKQISTLANRKALVIGNDSYKLVSPLTNAREDAKTIASELANVGYNVTLRLDLTEKELKSTLRTFKNQIDSGDEVAFFFAGHGVQIDNSNFLLPIDVAGGGEDQVRDEAIALQRILDDIASKKAKFTLAVVDACRDNPFRGNGRAIGGGTRGLAPTTAATGQMVIFSAGAGQQALDKLGANDNSKNGVFTRVFAREIRTPGISVDRLVRNVRSQVVNLAKSVGHEQVPAIYDQVVGEFYFKK